MSPSESEIAPPVEEVLPPSTSAASSDDEVILPSSYWGGEHGTVPIFTPTMEQFRSFPDFIKKIDHYGMKTGIVKVIPPQEWLDRLPELDEKVKSIRVQSAIEQNFAGSGGAFRQMNLEKHRTYSLPQWRKICDSSEHQPPAKRGEARGVGGRKQKPRKVNSPPATPPATTDSDDSGSPEPRATPRQNAKTKAKPNRKQKDCDAAESIDFDYRIDDNDQYTEERCQELERSYWKSLTFNNPMYGADLPGSLFDDDIKEWNVAHLDNILSRLGVVLPGVNSAYLYLGMWKASFSWHVEDMDLYSINYIHFGAPKQWYSVSQEDNQKFEKVMKDIFPNDARHCGQFMRHKTFGASPARLAQHGLEVNKLVHYEKEFVITFPYGYHSGYNLGYNCAESVNFATEEWLEYGKVAQKCECVTDAVSIDVNDIIRALDGTDPDEELDEDAMLTPPASENESSSEESSERPTYSEFERLRRPNKKKRSRDLIYDKTSVVQYKRLSEKYHGKTATQERTPPKPIVKKIKLTMPKAPCSLCPRTPRHEQLLDAGEGRKVHRICAELVPETRVEHDPLDSTVETVTGYHNIDKARLALKCIHCKVVAGACFQCSAPKCVRAFHGSCAYDAGVLVQKIEPTAENSESTYHFLCKTHRPRRPPQENLEFDFNVAQYASNLELGQVAQAQFAFGHSFAGLVRENRRSERVLLLEVGNDGDKIEVDYQWILASPRKVIPKATVPIEPTEKVTDDTTSKVLPVLPLAVPSTHDIQPASTPGAYVHPYHVAQGYFRPAQSVAAISPTTPVAGIAIQSSTLQPIRPMPSAYIHQTDQFASMAQGLQYQSLPGPQMAVAPGTVHPFHSNLQEAQHIQPRATIMNSAGFYYPGVPQYFKIGSDVPIASRDDQHPIQSTPL